MNLTRRRITKNGGSYAVNLPRPAMHYLGWQPGEELTVRVTERQTIEFARASVLDFAPPSIHQFLSPPADTVKR